MTHTPDAELASGRRAAACAAAEGRVLVIVDVLSFSTCVSTAVARGATVVPCGRDEDPSTLAAEAGARLAAPRPVPPRADVFSLSPVSLLGLRAGERLVLPSPNGSTATRMARGAPAVFAGCLRNMTATARAARATARGLHCGLTVVACGERVHATGEWRFALEDHLGAGAVLSALELPLHGRARRWAQSFCGHEEHIHEVIRACESGRELIDKGYATDVEHATLTDADDCAARLGYLGYGSEPPHVQLTGPEA